MTYGTFQIAGVQSGTPQGGQSSLGPFAIAFGPVTKDVPVGVATTATVAVPPTSAGVCIIPPIGATSPTLQFKTVVDDTGTYINPGQPTLITWDPANVPANLYLVSGSSVTVQVQFI